MKLSCHLIGAGRAASVLAILLLAIQTITAGPSRYGFSDRVERHLFPEVTTGPSEPTWSPDGKWIAFSMQGDIWKIPSEGGEAIALTHGPAYYFEPAWSPDGKWIAMTMDPNEERGKLQIGVVSAEGGVIKRATDGPIDIEPAWGPDSAAIVFASARNRGFDLFVAHQEGTVAPFVADAGDQIQPAISPDGKTLSYVSPVQGRLGTGGIWTRALDASGAVVGAPQLVHYEESEYRMRPAWTPDSRALIFGSDERGSNDIAIVAVSGGNPAIVTTDPMGEFSAAPSPDGKSIAFISNRTGPMTLEIAPSGGGPRSSWRDVPITSKRRSVPFVHLHGRVVGEDGLTMPARVEIVASDGRSYAPTNGFARVIAATETHYFHTDGEFDVDVPPGPLKLEVLRGFEYGPSTANFTISVPTNLNIRLLRLVDARARGWYSGDTHAHDLHQGRFGLTHQSLFLQSLAEDLHVTNVLIHMDGTRLMGRWEDLTGRPDSLSTPTHILQFAQEFRGSLGHIGLLGINKYVLPLVGGEPNTAYAQVASDVPYLDGARAQGGIAGYMHPYTSSSPNPTGWAGSLIPVDVALGKGEFYDVASLYSDERASSEIYHRLLNCGFRLAATGGTDNFPDVWRDPPPGTDRTYAKVAGPLTLQSWLAAVKAGRTFSTTGPLVFVTVNGKEPGDELRLGANAVVRVQGIVASIVPITQIEFVVNGKVESTLAGTSEFDQQVPMPEGGTITVRVIGPSSKHVGDSYAFAETSPVYVVRDGKPFVSREDAQFLAGVVDAIWARASRSPWRSDAERDAFKREIDQARAVYLRLAGSATR